MGSLLANEPIFKRLTPTASQLNQYDILKSGNFLKGLWLLYEYLGTGTTAATLANILTMLQQIYVKADGAKTLFDLSGEQLLNLDTKYFGRTLDYLLSTTTDNTYGYNMFYLPMSYNKRIKDADGVPRVITDLSRFSTLELGVRLGAQAADSDTPRLTLYPDYIEQTGRKGVERLQPIHTYWTKTGVTTTSLNNIENLPLGNLWKYFILYSSTGVTSTATDNPLYTTDGTSLLEWQLKYGSKIIDYNPHGVIARSISRHLGIEGKRIEAGADGVTGSNEALYWLRDYDPDADLQHVLNTETLKAANQKLNFSWASGGADAIGLIIAELERYTV